MFAVGLDELLYSFSVLPIASIKDNRYSLRELQEIIFGSLLGDGKLELAARSVNARFGFIQSTIHAPYFIFLYKLLGGFCSSTYREYSYLDKRTSKTYSSLTF